MTTYPHVRFFGFYAAAYPAANSAETACLGSVSIAKDTATNRRRAEQDLRRMFPARK